MIVDSSVLIAVLTKESDGDSFARIMNEPGVLRISAATYLETSIVIDKHRDPVLSAGFDELLHDLEAIVEPVTAEQAQITRQAYRDYGRGSGHRANLNFGDCFAYALARVKHEPLLYKGDDFVHTDLRSA
jgi:ribonuclease VapC